MNPLIRHGQHIQKIPSTNYYGYRAWMLKLPGIANQTLCSL